MQVKERLYLNADKTKVVRSNDIRGRHLFCKKGAEISKEEAEFYGVVDGYLKDGASVADQVVTPLSKAKIVEPKEGETMKSKEEDKKNNQIIPPETKRSEGLKIFKLNKNKQAKTPANK